MNKDKLMKIIREVVKQEIRKQMNEILINEEKVVKVSKAISKPQPKRKVQKKHYTKDKALNKVLNETKGLTARENSGEFDDYPALGDGVLGSDNMAEVLGYGDLGGVQNKERAREFGAVDTIKKAGVSVDSVPEGLQDALTRDYSGLMKAIDKKKKGEGNFRP